VPRSYDHYCAVSRALDRVGDRWTLLVVRELLCGPRRYSDLFADLPGISTDILAARLKDLERDGVATRRRLGTRTSATVYELTDDGRALGPVLKALSVWGSRHMDERRATDAVRAHWFALPLGRALVEHITAGVVTVHIGDTTVHYDIGESGVTHHDGPAPAADLELRFDLETVVDVAAGRRALPWPAVEPEPDRTLT